MTRMPRVAGVLLAGVISCASAQDIRFKYDVPYVPSPQVTVDEMLRLAEVGPQDYVMDLGSGDGRIVVTAARKFGARGMGVDLDSELVALSEENARAAGVQDRVKFVVQDIFKTDLRPATVIAMYLLPVITRRLRPELLELKPGTRIVSHDFDLDDWKPDRKTYVRKNVYVWIVPAKMEGQWRAQLALAPIERVLELAVTQKFQEISAHARLNGVPTPVWEARLDGERISFAVVDRTDRENETTLYFTGRVAGDTIDGEVTSGVGNAKQTVKWRAMRTGR